jgi:non-ribosomal peptide synthetase component F
VTVLDAIRARARERPDAPALVAETADGTVRVSYRALAERMEEGAKRLGASGIGPGDRCGLLASQGPGFVLEALSILATGACLVPISSDHAGATLERFAEQACLHHVVRETEDGFSTKRRTRRTSLGEETDAAFRALAPAYLRFTSGTTSERKGVILSHERIVERLAAANDALAIGPDDRVLWLLPMAHHFVVSILLYLSNGATILLPESSLTRPVLELAGRERATVLYASPFHHHLLSKDASGLPLAGLRLAISTAEGLRAEVAARFRERFGIALSQALGIIEVGLPVVNLDEAATKPTGLGRPLPAYDVWLPHRRDLHPRARALRRVPRAVDARRPPRRARRLPHRRPGLVRRGRNALPGGPPPQPHQHGGHEVLRRGGGDGARAAPGGARVPRVRATPRTARRDPRRGDRARRSRARAEAGRAPRALPRGAADLQDPARGALRRNARAHDHGEGEALSGRASSGGPSARASSSTKVAR